MEKYVICDGATVFKQYLCKLKGKNKYTFMPAACSLGIVSFATHDAAKNFLNNNSDYFKQHVDLSKVEIECIKTKKKRSLYD